VGKSRCISGEELLSNNSRQQRKEGGGGSGTLVKIKRSADEGGKTNGDTDQSAEVGKKRTIKRARPRAVSEHFRRLRRGRIPDERDEGFTGDGPLRTAPIMESCPQGKKNVFNAGATVKKVGSVLNVEDQAVRLVSRARKNRWGKGSNPEKRWEKGKNSDLIP